MLNYLSILADSLDLVQTIYMFASPFRCFQLKLNQGVGELTASEIKYSVAQMQKNGLQKYVDTEADLLSCVMLQ